MPEVEEAGLPARIKRARERLRWTQNDLARAVGVHRRTVDNWENGRTHPRNRVGALEEVLNLSGNAPQTVDAVEAIRRSSWFSDEEKEALIATLRAIRAATGAKRDEAG